MEPADRLRNTGEQRLQVRKALSEDHLPLRHHQYFQVGRNARFGFGSPGGVAKAKEGLGHEVERGESPSDIAACHPRESLGDTKDLKLGLGIGQGGTTITGQKAADRVFSPAQIDPNLVVTMDAEDFNTQPTQRFTDPRRLGHRGSGMSEDDAVDVICILHPSAPAAHDAVAATIEHDFHHIIPNEDLAPDEDESLLEPAARSFQASREIALRISSSVKDPSTGFTFGRNPDRCDVLLTKDSNDTAVSGRHFRIYVSLDGVLMLQDTSTNGTLVDEKHLTCKKGKKTDDSSRMLQNGTIICVLRSDSADIKFLVRIPSRGNHQEAYNINLSKHLTGRLGTQSRVMLSTSENNYGMHWNGGSIYNVVGCLGKGAFATVYKLATKKDGQVYAAKELDKRRFMKNNVLDIKFDNEIRIMKDLRHPHIVQYQDYHDHEDWVYIIMENVPYGELSMYLHKRGPIIEQTVQAIARQILHALAYLHARGITHRDIKPDNILVSQCDPLLVKLSDFGLSKCITDQDTFLKTFCGTLLYCAPEIYPGYLGFGEDRSRKRHRYQDVVPKRYSERVDMWSFGAVLFHVLCDRPPFMVDTEEQNKANAMLSTIMTTDVDVGPLRARSISEKGVDFVSGLLKRNPSLRPTPKACFEHAWISEVADTADYVDLDDEMPAYRGQGLATVPEVEDGLLTESEEAALGQLVGHGRLSVDYLSTASERISKRQRMNAQPKAKFAVPASNQVKYPTLPDMPSPIEPSAAETGGQRLFGEITPSLLQSSGVFGRGEAPTMVAHDGLQNIHQGSPRDYGTPGSTESSSSTREALDGSATTARAVGGPGPHSASSPSLLGAELQIGQLRVTSTNTARSEATTPDTPSPATPRGQEDSPGMANHNSSDTVKACEDPVDEASEQPVFSRYVDPQIPKSLAHGTELISTVKNRNAETKQRRVLKAGASAFTAEQETAQGQQRLTQSLNLQVGRVLGSEDEATQREPKILPRMKVPHPESFSPTNTTTTDKFTKPRTFGKLVSLPGSYANVTIWIKSRMTSWGRGINCDAQYDDKSDVRIPHYAIQITYHAPGIESRITKGEQWEDVDGLHTVVSTGTTTGCIWVNGVELRKESSVERCAYYGKIYTGDVITVYQSMEPNGPFLKFRVQIQYGDSAESRPQGEQGFQVLKDTYHYRREMKRRENLKMLTGKETITRTPTPMPHPAAGIESGTNSRGSKAEMDDRGSD